MEYEIVNLKGMKIEGVSARTKNSDPNMPVVIGSLWDKSIEEEFTKELIIKPIIKL